MILQCGYSLFCQIISKKGWIKTPFISFHFLETVQKVGKKVDIHIFESINFEKNLPVTEVSPYSFSRVNFKI